RRINKGRRVRTGTVSWFMTLYTLAGLRRFRRRLMRHAREMEHIGIWLATAEAVLPANYDLAVEVVGCRRLVKGYSDTHARGQSKFDRVMGTVPVLRERSDGAEWLKRLRQAALLDEEGKALDGAIKTVETL
ncbi:DUF6537 domain-containing protein, partial [Rhizobiaceae sp. 2RAB30]